MVNFSNVILLVVSIDTVGIHGSVSSYSITLSLHVRYDDDDVHTCTNFVRVKDEFDQIFSVSSMDDNTILGTENFQVFFLSFDILNI